VSLRGGQKGSRRTCIKETPEESSSGVGGGTKKNRGKFTPDFITNAKNKGTCRKESGYTCKMLETVRSLRHRNHFWYAKEEGGRGKVSSDRAILKGEGGKNEKKNTAHVCTEDEHRFIRPDDSNFFIKW